MNNEVKGEIDKLQTTVRFDEENGALVTILKIWSRGLTPSQLHTLFSFQSTGALSFTVSSAQQRLFPTPLEKIPLAPELPEVKG